VRKAAGVDDGDIASLKELFTEDKITALTAWIAFQNMSAKFNAAFGAEEHGFCRLPTSPGALSVPVETR
jgi:alkylhydroperoxidase family enzyme